MPNWFSNTVYRNGEKQVVDVTGYVNTYIATGADPLELIAVFDIAEHTRLRDERNMKDMEEREDERTELFRIAD